MPAKVIPDAEVEHLLNEGKTLVEVSVWLRENRHLEVTPDAISIWRRRRGLPRIRPAISSDLIPWRIRPEHRFDHALNMLRFEARVRRGEAVPERHRLTYENWRERMVSGGWVVEYRPETEQGFGYVARRDGEDFVRMPEKITKLEAANRDAEQDVS